MNKISYNIFLDDERFPSNSDLRDYKIVRNYKDFCELISTLGLPDFISFDHDLGEGKTGHDCTKYLIEYCLDNKLKPNFEFYVHSQNPVGKQNIYNLINDFQKWAKYQGNMQMNDKPINILSDVQLTELIVTSKRSVNDFQKIEGPQKILIFQKDLLDLKKYEDFSKYDNHIPYDQYVQGTVTVSENKLDFRQTKWFAYSSINYEKGLGYTGGLVLVSGKEKDDIEYIYVIEKQFIQQSHFHKSITNTIKLKLLLNDENIQIARLYLHDYVTKPPVVRQGEP